MEATLTILGCGSSAGVPAIGNYWGACDPSEPRNRRTRPSVVVQSGGTTLILDTGPDFKDQMNRENIPCPDAFLYTHEHADHIAGLDEIRTLQRIYNGRKFTIHSDAETLSRIQQRFRYMFHDTENGFYPAVCEARPLSLYEENTIGTISFIPFLQDHSTMASVGFRFGDVAYSTDVKRLDDAAFDVLRGIKLWIIDGAGYDNPLNPVHACLSEVYAFNERVKASRVVITHMPPTMDYQTLLKTLPQGYEPAYDGMTFLFTL